MNIYASPTMAFVQKTSRSMPMIKTDFDKSIGKINIIPQDIGRVILNLLTMLFMQ